MRKLTYDELSWGDIQAALAKIEPERIKDVASGAVGIVLAKPWHTIQMGFRTWQTVQLGNFQTEAQLRTALDQAKISHSTVEGIELAQPQTVELVLVQIEDLDADFRNMSEEVSMPQMYSAAQKLGLGYCPDETAAQVLLQCKVESPPGHNWEQIQFAMDPDRREGHGFRITKWHKENTYTVGRFSNWHRRTPNSEFVFVRKE